MNTFAKNIFIDSNGLIKILKIANEQQGGSLSRDQLSQFTEQVKRSRQTLDDWILYASLQDGSILPKINEIKSNQSQLIKLSLPCLKEPSKLSSTLPVILQTFYNISRILFSILRDQATDVEGLLDVIKISEEENHKHEAAVEKEGLSSSDYLAQRKTLSMAILVDLKQITALIVHFISCGSFPENSPIFASTARSIIQNTLALVQFLAKHSPTSKAESLKQLIMNLVSFSKEIVQQGEQRSEETITEQANKVENLKAAIANTLKDILSLPSQPISSLGAGTSPNPLLSSSTSLSHTENDSQPSHLPPATSGDPKRRLSNPNTHEIHSISRDNHQMPRHSTISNPMGSSNNPPPSSQNSYSHSNPNSHSHHPNFLSRTSQFQANQRSGSVSDVGRDLFNSHSKTNKLSAIDSEPLPLKSYKSSDDARLQFGSDQQLHFGQNLQDSISSLHDSFQQASPAPGGPSFLSPRGIPNGFSHHRSSSLSTSHSIDSFHSIFDDNHPNNDPSSLPISTTNPPPPPAAAVGGGSNTLLSPSPSNLLIDSIKDDSLPSSSLSKSMSYNDALSSLSSNSEGEGGPGGGEKKEGGPGGAMPPLESSGSFTNIQEINEKQKKKAIERQHAFKEIISSEKIYFKNLQFVYWGIIMPLEELAKEKVSWITEQEINMIFSNWKSLMFFNKELMKRLEHKKNMPIEEREIGATFLELAPHMKMYTQFINDFDTSSATLELCLQKDEFYNFIQKCLEGAPTQGLDMRSYLIMPVQRLPRYEMLLRALWKLTDDHHFDFTNLANAVTTVKGINDHVNSKNRENANKAIVVDIQRKISALEKDLVAPHRSFIREGSLSFINSVNPKKTKKKELFYFFLFNDILLRCKYNKKKNSYEFREQFELSDYYLRDIKYNPFMSNSERFCFKIVKQIDEKVGVSFYASSEEEKKDWVLDIEQVIKIRDAADNTRMSISVSN